MEAGRHGGGEIWVYACHAKSGRWCCRAIVFNGLFIHSVDYMDASLGDEIVES